MTPPPTAPREPPIRVGISACILGHEVRFNGGHKLDRFLRETLGAFVDFVPICPEVDVGLGVPRETLRLVGRPSSPALVATRSGADLSAAMVAYARRKAAELTTLDLCGFILQKGSPSCGMARVKVYPAADGGTPRAEGRGLFARVLLEELPLLPVEEDGRLQDPVLREHFLERVFAYHRLRSLFRDGWTVRELVDFQAREKLLLMAHADYKPLGQLVARGTQIGRAELEHRYRALFLETLAERSTVGKHVNVLQHIAGYFRGELALGSRQEVEDVIAAYQRKLVPLVVPMTLVKHHILTLGLDYLAAQSYLDPHPRELRLRNHV